MINYIFVYAFIPKANLLVVSCFVLFFLNSFNLLRFFTQEAKLTKLPGEMSKNGLTFLGLYLVDECL